MLHVVLTAPNREGTALLTIHTLTEVVFILESGTSAVS